MPEDHNQVVIKIRHSLKATRIMARRTVKTPTEETTDEIEVEFADGEVHPREVQIASHLVGLQVEILAHQHALANGSIPERYFHDQLASLKAQYAHLIEQEFDDAESP